MEEYKLLVTERRVVDVKAKDLDEALEHVDKILEDHFDKHPECHEPIVCLEHDIVVPPVDETHITELDNDYDHFMRKLKPGPAIERALVEFLALHEEEDRKMVLTMIVNFLNHLPYPDDQATSS
jgi:hypothetical protein